MIPWLGKINCGTNSRFKEQKQTRGDGIQSTRKELVLAKSREFVSYNRTKAEYLGIDSIKLIVGRGGNMVCGVLSLAAYSILFCFSYSPAVLPISSYLPLSGRQSLCAGTSYFLYNFFIGYITLAMFSIPSKYLSPPNLSLAVTSPLSLDPCIHMLSWHFFWNSSDIWKLNIFQCQINDLLPRNLILPTAPHFIEPFIVFHKPEPRRHSWYSFYHLNHY